VIVANQLQFLLSLRQGNQFIVENVWVSTEVSDLNLEIEWKLSLKALITKNRLGLGDEKAGNNSLKLIFLPVFVA